MLLTATRPTPSSYAYPNAAVESQQTDEAALY